MPFFSKKVVHLVLQSSKDILGCAHHCQKRNIDAEGLDSICNGFYISSVSFLSLFSIFVIVLFKNSTLYVQS